MCERVTSTSIGLSPCHVPNVAGATEPSPHRRARTAEWCPSAPTSRSPVAAVPSPNVAVTRRPSCSTPRHSLPYSTRSPGSPSASRSSRRRRETTLVRKP
nr:hypothetical protein [Actinomadura sp. J1-007]